MTAATAFKAVAGNYGSIACNQANGLIYTIGNELHAPRPPGIHALDTLEQARDYAWHVDPILKQRVGVRIVELAYDPADMTRPRGSCADVLLQRCHVVAEHPLGPSTIRRQPRWDTAHLA